MKYDFFFSPEGESGFLSDDVQNTSEQPHDSSGDNDHDSVFQTCVSGPAESQSLSSSRTCAGDAVSRRLRWGGPRDPSRPASRGGWADSASERSGPSRDGCTFRPRVSPNSSALFRRAARERGENRLTVFQRLFPHKENEGDRNEKEEEEEEEVNRKREEANRKREKAAAADCKALARAELEALREQCGALTAARAGGDTFELFVHNTVDAGNSNSHPPFVRTAYRTSAAIAAENAPDATRRMSRRYREALFHEFLDRQNAHMTGRMRSVQELEDALTPSFKPAISETSAVIAKELLVRSGATHDSVNASTLASAVKKHRSPYVDECTFSPKILPVSSAMAPRGAELMTKDAVRLRKARERAQEEAKAKELEHPFRPTLNDDRNAHVESLLNPNNYARYEEYIRHRKLKLAEMKSEKDARRESDGKADCTFRPKITRPPRYIARMASSFSLVRQQYGEL